MGSFSSESNRASDTELRPILSEWERVTVVIYPPHTQPRTTAVTPYLCLWHLGLYPNSKISSKWSLGSGYGVDPPRPGFICSELLYAHTDGAYHSSHTGQLLYIWHGCLSILTAPFSRWTRLIRFIGDKDDASGGDNWSYRTCKAPVKSSPPTNQHPTFYRPDVVPVAQPTVSKRRGVTSITFRMTIKWNMWVNTTNYSCNSSCSSVWKQLFRKQQQKNFSSACDHVMKTLRERCFTKETISLISAVKWFIWRYQGHLIESPTNPTFYPMERYHILSYGFTVLGWRRSLANKTVIQLRPKRQQSRNNWLCLDEFLIRWWWNTYGAGGVRWRCESWRCIVSGMSRVKVLL